MLLSSAAAATAAVAAESSIAETVRQIQPKIVKVYGAGGFRQMEAYQTGMLVSPEGHVLTVWSYVLDTDYLKVTLSDGRPLQATLVGADPRLEIAVLKVDAADLPYFDLSKAVEAKAGARVLAFSNLFGIATGNEAASVQHGVVAVKTQLQARRGVFETPYDGPVYVLDAATNNPGAAGGALVTRNGELLGMLGKELRNALNNTWLNYALPIGQLRDPVEQIRAGKFMARREETDQKPERPLTLAALGLVLVPDVVERTPPYVDHILPGSSAAEAGVRVDDLVLLVGDRLVPSCKALRRELERTHYDDGVKLTVQRGQQLLEFELQARNPQVQTAP